MDKAYDSERIHQLIHEDLQSQSMIPIRDWYVGFLDTEKIVWGDSLLPFSPTASERN